MSIENLLKKLTLLLGEGYCINYVANASPTFINTPLYFLQ